MIFGGLMGTTSGVAGGLAATDPKLVPYGAMTATFLHGTGMPDGTAGGVLCHPCCGVNHQQPDQKSFRASPPSRVPSPRQIARSMFSEIDLHEPSTNAT